MHRAASLNQPIDPFGERTSRLNRIAIVLAVLVVLPLISGPSRAPAAVPGESMGRIVGQGHSTPPTYLAPAMASMVEPRYCS